MKKKYLTTSEARVKVDDVISEEIHFQSKTHLEIFERILSKVILKRVYEKIWIDGYIYARMKDLDKEVSFYYLFDGVPVLAKDMTSEQLHIAGEKPAAFLWNKTKKNYTEWKTSKEIKMLLKKLLNLSLQEVEIYRRYGLINDDIYWEYYHLWKFGSVKFANHPICKCGECLHNGEPKDTDETIIKTLKKIREIRNS